MSNEAEEITSFNVVQQGRKFAHLPKTIHVDQGHIFFTHIRSHHDDCYSGEATVAYVLIRPDGNSVETSQRGRNVLLASAIARYNPDDAHSGTFFNKKQGRSVARDRLLIGIRNASMEGTVPAEEWWFGLDILEIPVGSCHPNHMYDTVAPPAIPFVHDSIRQLVRRRATLMSPFEAQFDSDDELDSFQAQQGFVEDELAKQIGYDTSESETGGTCGNGCSGCACTSANG